MWWVKALTYPTPWLCLYPGVNIALKEFVKHGDDSLDVLVVPGPHCSVRYVDRIVKCLQEKPITY